MDRNEFLINQGYSKELLKALQEYENRIGDTEIITELNDGDVTVTRYDVSESQIQIKNNEKFNVQISNF